jgi:glycosyltransferase involved in cell wall biosynthesis
MPIAHSETAEGPLVAVYRELLLHYNEVYVRSEVESLRRYRSFYIGSRLLGDVPMPADRTFTLRERFAGVDRLLDPVVRRVGYRLERLGPLASLGGRLAPGRVVGSATEYLFQRYGVSPTLLGVLRPLRPALLHAYTGVSGAHALPLARALGVPLVVSFGGYDATATDEELRRWPLRGGVFLARREAMKREIALAITVSDFLRGKLCERGWPADKIVVRTRGVDTALFTPEGAPPLADRAPVVFFAGRLIEVKGVEFLVRAMQRVRARVPEASLLVAGAGPLGGSLQALARVLGVPARFLGAATQEQIRACHAQAMVCCMPSVTATTGQEEGLPNALLEAMASGLPAVGSASGGIGQAIGDAGILVPERDVATLADRLVDVLTDAELRARLGAAARQRILRCFELSAQTAKLETLYDEVRRRHAEEGRRPRDPRQAKIAIPFTTTTPVP